MKDFVTVCAAELIKHMREGSWPLVCDALVTFLVDNEPGSATREREVRQGLEGARGDLLLALERGEEDTAADVEAELRMRLRRVLRDRPRAITPLRLLVSQFLETGLPRELGPRVGQLNVASAAPAREVSIPSAVDAVTGKILRQRRTEVVAVLLFRGGPIFESSIPLSVFGIDRQDAGVPRYRMLVAAGEDGPLPTTGGLELIAPHGLDAISRAGTVVVPAWRSITSQPPEEALDALRRAHEEGARIVGLRRHLIWLGKLPVMVGIVERLVPEELWELFQ
ncbi:hypothetical protein ACFYV9_41850, partial [Streptomyces sp. NPDC002952]